jgi:hypothetical protein
VDEEQEKPPRETYAVKIWIAAEGDALPAYHDETWFVERPHREIVRQLFEEAKETYAALYPGVEPVDCTVHVIRNRPADDFRPDFRGMF